MDDPDHRSRIAALSTVVERRPKGSLVRVGKQDSHTPYSNLSGYGSDQRYHPVDLSGLTRILAFDEKNGAVTVEGGVEMFVLCRQLLEKGFLPAVCPEGESFTVAGIINGFGIQSSSHRFGLFHDAVIELEVLRGDGSVVRASASLHADLFALLPGSFGTLGLVTAATLRCMRATPRVRTVGTHFRDATLFSAAMLGALRGEGSGNVALGRLEPLSTPSAALAPDAFPRASAFIEGFAFAQDSFVLLETDFLSEALSPATSAPTTPPGSPYYYQRVRDLAAAALPPGTPFEFEQGTLEYAFRLTRGIWWLLEHHIGIPALTGTRLGRSLLETAMAAPSTAAAAAAPPQPQRGWQPRAGINFSHADYTRCLVTQGFYVRQSRLAPMLAAVHEQLGIYPLWTCPVRVFSMDAPNGPAVSADTAAAAVAAAGKEPPASVQSCGRLWRRLHGDGGGAASGVGWCLDVGCYGQPAASGYRAFSSVRALQAIADTPSQWGLSYMTRGEMQREGSAGGILDAGAYLAACKAHGAEGAFPPLWDKVRGFEAGVSCDGPIIPCWRLRRDGMLGCCVFFATSITVVAFSILLYYIWPTALLLYKKSAAL